MALKGVVNEGFQPHAGHTRAQSDDRYAWYDAEAGPLEPDTGMAAEDRRQQQPSAASWQETESLATTMDVAAQTEEAPQTISSWKILRTNASGEASTSISSGSSEYVVIETRSTGFNAATQTRDAPLFRYTDAQVSDMVMAWRMLTIFMPCTWYLIMYVVDQMTSVIVAVDFCSSGNQWWCGVTVTFLVLPSLAINAYSYEQLTRPDIASVAPVNKWLARLLFLIQVAPHYLICRKVIWCFRAWRAQSWQQKKQQQQQQQPQETQQQQYLTLRKLPQELWEQARAETDSATVKWFHSLLESVPQLSIQSYIMMVMVQPTQCGKVKAALIASVVVSLTSASSGLASVLSERAWERVAASMAIFLTLGSRVLVCGGVGTIHPALWFAPIASATLLGFVTKIAESKGVTFVAIITKTHKYAFEALMMAAVCPPFNTVGVFASAPYVLAGICFLMLDPGAFANIGVFLFSILGQSVWLAVGFFVTK